MSDERALRAAPHPPTRIVSCVGAAPPRPRGIGAAPTPGAPPAALAAPSNLPPDPRRPAPAEPRRSAAHPHPPGLLLDVGAAPPHPSGTFCARHATVRHLRGPSFPRALSAAEAARVCVGTGSGRIAWAAVAAEHRQNRSGPAPEAPLSGRVAESVQCRSGGGVGAQPPQRRNPGAGGWASRAQRALVRLPGGAPAALRLPRPPSPSGRRRPASRPRRSAGTAR